MLSAVAVVSGAIGTEGEEDYIKDQNSWQLKKLASKITITVSFKEENHLKGKLLSP